MTREAKQLLIAIAVQIALQRIALSLIGGGMGCLIWALATITQGLHIYSEDRGGDAAGKGLCDEVRAMSAIVLQLTILWYTAERIGGGIGLLVYVLATALQGMYIYYEDQREQARKRERRKIKKFAEGIQSAYEKYERSFESDKS